MAFVTMATDSKQLYLISHDHRTKKRKDFGCPSSFFILSGRRCTGAFEDLPIMFNHPAFTTTSSTTVVATISP